LGLFFFLAAHFRALDRLAVCIAPAGVAAVEPFGAAFLAYLAGRDADDGGCGRDEDVPLCPHVRR